jgi:hypothetical protein
MVISEDEDNGKRSALGETNRTSVCDEEEGEGNTVDEWQAIPQGYNTAEKPRESYSLI